MSIMRFVAEKEIEHSLRKHSKKKGDISKIVNDALRQHLPSLDNPLSEQEEMLLIPFAEDLYRQYSVLEENLILKELKIKYPKWTYSKMIAAIKYILTLKK